MSVTPVQQSDPNRVVFTRLEDQIAWYDTKAARNQRNYRYTSVGQIAIAAIIVIVASIPAPGVFIGPVGLAAVLAGVLAVMKGMETAFQWQSNWVNYRAAAESLKHEKYLYYGKGGPYADAPNPDRLLAERVEDVIAHENGGWTSRSQPPATAGPEAKT